jgi:hypothetical protein
MRRLKILFTFILSIALISSCKDDSLSPVPFKQVTTTYGGYVKELEISSATYHIEDLANSSFKITVEVYDGKHGDNFESLDIYATLEDNSPKNGTVEPAEAKVMSFPASQFTIDATSGYPTLELSIPATTAIAALGLTEAQVGGADVFNFRQVLNMKDGNSYTTTNTGLDILAGPFYKSPFTNGCSVVCPSTIEGTYNVVSNGVDQIDGSAHSNITATVTLTHTSPGSTSYDVDDMSAGVFKAVYYPVASYGAPEYVPYVMSEACGKLIILAGDDGWGDVFSGSGTVNDDGTLTIHWITNYGDDWTATYTKQ